MENQTRPLSYSSLKQFDKSPNHLLAYWNRDLEPSAAMIKGTLIHSLVLEPDTFDERYAIFEGKVKRGKAYDEFVQENVGKTIISVADYNKASIVKEAVWKNSAVQVMFNETHTTEEMVYWTDEDVEFRGIVDGKGDDFIFDLKTCQSSEPRKFASDAFKYGYHIQAAMYMKATGASKYYIIAVESEAPHNVTLFKMTSDLLVRGNEEYYRMIDKFKAWDGEPAPYSDIIEPLMLPAWAAKPEAVDRF